MTEEEYWEKKHQLDQHQDMRNQEYHRVRMDNAKKRIHQDDHIFKSNLECHDLYKKNQNLYKEELVIANESGKSDKEG